MTSLSRRISPASLFMILLSVPAVPALALEGFRFDAIEGGTLDLADWRGRPVLVVNTASLCAYSGQYDDLQALQDRYGDRIVVLAVPSDDFNQELANEAAVRDYCAVNFDLTIPMTTITTVTGENAHPFYAWAEEVHGFVPAWNFSKVLLAPDGTYVDGWGPGTGPTDTAITARIDAALR